MRLAAPLRGGKRLGYRGGNADALTGRGEVAFELPAPVAAHLVRGIGTVALEEAVGEAKRHCRVVAPGTAWQFEGTAADHVAERREGARLSILHAHAERIADGKPDERAVKAVAKILRDIEPDLAAEILFVDAGTPGTDILGLRRCFRDGREELRAGVRAPEHVQAFEGRDARGATLDEVAADHGAGPPDAGPAVQVDIVAQVERAAEILEDFRHVKAFGGDIVIDDGLAHIDHGLAGRGAGR